LTETKIPSEEGKNYSLIRASPFEPDSHTTP
jgi:hypothetical protein